MAQGRKTGGRQKGTPNRVDSETRAILKRIVDKRLKDLDAMIEDTWRGIEIEKQMPDGTTVVGRLNADPGRAAKLVLEAAKFVVPELARAEVVGADGGPLIINIVKAASKS